MARIAIAFKVKCTIALVHYMRPLAIHQCMVNYTFSTRTERMLEFYNYYLAVRNTFNPI